MTPNEHRLIIEMFYHQDRLMAALTEALKSKGYLDSGDLPAYDALISARDDVRSRMLHRVEECYRESAALHGVQIPEL